MNITVDGDAAPKVHLLLLPPEVRRRIFVFLVQMPVATPFPPQEQAGTVNTIRSWLCGPKDALLVAPTSVTEWQGYRSKRNVHVDVPLVCHQIYKEIRILAFQVNSVRLKAHYGSNVFATMQFLEKLTPIQLSAIRSLELDLRANPTESWRLGKILRSVGHANENLRRGRGSDSPHDEQLGLRVLKMGIRTDDAWISESESIFGLQHFLTTGAPVAESQGDPVGISHESWMMAGLVLLRSLEMIDIELKMSSLAASRISSSHRSMFQEKIRRLVPQTCRVQVNWNQQPQSRACLEPYEWTDIFWTNSFLVGSVKA